jgi:lipoic acid synthetase
VLVGRTATFMILGDVCTRRCGFCAVTSGRPSAGVDADEPRHLAEAVAKLGIRHAVITSVDRDDLPDGGAGHFAAVMRALRERVPECAVEILTPDFKGVDDPLTPILAARPDIFSHNVETVPRLYRTARPGSSYTASLALLAEAARRGAPRVKTGVMVGLGESREELKATLRDIRDTGTAVLTVGQYLQPTTEHLPVARYVPPAEFGEIRSGGSRWIRSRRGRAARPFPYHARPLQGGRTVRCPAETQVAGVTLEMSGPPPPPVIPAQAESNGGSHGAPSWTPARRDPAGMVSGVAPCHRARWPLLAAGLGAADRHAHRRGRASLGRTRRGGGANRVGRMRRRASGREVYRENCATCHGASGKGMATSPISSMCRSNLASAEAMAGQSDGALRWKVATGSFRCPPSPVTSMTSGSGMS